MKPTYDFYTDEFGGVLSEERFDAGLSRAKSKVDYLIFPNEVTDGNETAYLRAICSAVDAYGEYGESGAVGSMKIGSFSITADRGGRSTEQIVVDFITGELVLACPSLLYKGVS